MNKLEECNYQPILSRCQPKCWHFRCADLITDWVVWETILDIICDTCEAAKEKGGTWGETKDQWKLWSRVSGSDSCRSPDSNQSHLSQTCRQESIFAGRVKQEEGLLLQVTRYINRETDSGKRSTFSLLIVLVFLYFHVAIWKLFSTWLAHEACT